ncbi:kinase-like domain-containing protein, partial [Jimgerdemannia flammicorona]
FFSPLSLSDPLLLNIALPYQQIIHHHLHTERKPIPEVIVKSFLWQLINGVAYLHANWVLHRDLKPANILVTSEGVVKIGDLGLARLFNKPLQPLFNGDKVVVTIWYRAPELLLGSRHYTKAIDMWAVGCIFGELLALKPIFKGEEAKMDSKKNVPFQRSQLTKIFETLGTPTSEWLVRYWGRRCLVLEEEDLAVSLTLYLSYSCLHVFLYRLCSEERWPTIDQLPDYSNLSSFPQSPPNLSKVYNVMPGAPGAPGTGSNKNESAFNLLSMMLEYDPARRITAEDALNHQYFLEDPKPAMNSFAQHGTEYPLRRVTQEDNDMKTVKHPNPPTAKEDPRAAKKPRNA